MDKENQSNNNLIANGEKVNKPKKISRLDFLKAIFLGSAALGTAVIAKKIFKPEIKKVVSRIEFLLDQPEILIPTGDTHEVSLVVGQIKSASVSFPESRYTKKFTQYLGEEFINFNNETWWDRFHEMLENSSKSKVEQSELNLIHEVPDITWLQENVRRNVEKPLEYVRFLLLPTDGELSRVDSKEDYEEYLNKYPDEGPFDTNNFHQVIAGDILYSTYYKIFTSVDYDDSYIDRLDDIQEAFDGKLLYQFADKERYLLIELPEEFLSLVPDDLTKEKKEFVFQVKILESKK